MNSTANETERRIRTDLNEFKKSSKPSPSSSSSAAGSGGRTLWSLFSKIPLWLLGLALANLALACAAFFTSTMVIYFYDAQLTLRTTYPQNSAPGAPCSLTSDCVLYAYCDIPSGSTTGYCTCSSGYYYVSGTSCTARLANAASCSSSSQCLLPSKGQICTGGTTLTCGCASTQFYNSTVKECQYLKPPYMICSASSECADSNSVCSSFDPTPGSTVKRCICQTGYGFNPYTGACFLLFQQGVSCSYNWQCIQGAYCGLNGGSSNKCWCDDYLYYANSACNTRVYSTSTTSVACTYAKQCNLADFNQRCIAGYCGCDQKYEKFDSSGYICITLSRYSQPCNSVSDCVSGFICDYPDFGGNQKICRCTSQSYYYDEVSASCVAVKSNGTLCTYRKECVNLAQCVTQGSGTQTRCYCLANYAYWDASSSACVLTKSQGSSCTYDYECQVTPGLLCIGTKCSCQTTKFYNSTANLCQWLGKLGDYCELADQCQTGKCTDGTCTST